MRARPRGESKPNTGSTSLQFRVGGRSTVSLQRAATPHSAGEGLVDSSSFFLDLSQYFKISNTPFTGEGENKSKLKSEVGRTLSDYI